MKRAARAEGTGRTGRRNPPPARRRGWGPDRGGGGSAGQVRRGAGWRPMVGRVDLTRIVGSVTRAQPDVKGVGAGSAGRSGGNPKVGGGGQGRPRPDGPRTGGSVDGHVGRRATDRLRYRLVRLWTCVPLRPMPACPHARMPACRPAVSAAATARTRHRMRWVRSHSVPSWEGRERRRPRARRSAVLLRPRRRRTPRVPTPWVAAVRAIAPVLPGGQGAWSEDPDGCAARSRGQIGPMWVRPAHPGPQGCLGAGAGAPGHSRGVRPDGALAPGGTAWLCTGRCGPRPAQRRSAGTTHTRDRVDAAGWHQLVRTPGGSVRAAPLDPSPESIGAVAVGWVAVLVLAWGEMAGADCRSTWVPVGRVGVGWVTEARRRREGRWRPVLVVGLAFAPRIGNAVSFPALVVSCLGTVGPGVMAQRSVPPRAPASSVVPREAAGGPGQAACHRGAGATGPGRIEHPVGGGWPEVVPRETWADQAPPVDGPTPGPGCGGATRPVRRHRAAVVPRGTPAVGGRARRVLDPWGVARKDGRRD